MGARPFCLAGGVLVLSSCSLLVSTSGLDNGFNADGGAGSVVDGARVAEGGPGGFGAEAGADGVAPCADTDRDALNCGRCGHSCVGDACIAGACQPAVITSGFSGGYGIDVDEASVYWSARGNSSVAKADKNATGASAALLFTLPDGASPRNVRVDGASVFVLNETSGSGTSTVYRGTTLTSATPLGLGGCSIDGAGGLAIDAANVFFVNGRTGELFRTEKTGEGSCNVLMTGPTGIADVVVDDQAAFFTNTDPSNGGLSTISKDGGTTTRLGVGSVTTAGAIATDLQQLYVATDDGKILRANKDGTNVVSLAGGQAQILQIVLDATTVYWSTIAGEIWAADKSNGPPRIVVAGQTGLGNIALDDARIYWVTDSAVVRVAK